MYGRSWRLLAFFLVALTAVVVSAQSQSPERGLEFTLPGSPPVGHVPRVGSPQVYDLPQLAAAAGTIFSGPVASVTRRSATRGQPIETVAITFHVETAIRGATPGEDFTISQWIGLWSGGQRYRVGERLLLFLYAPSKLGLTSCVGGGLGRFSLDPGGSVLLSAQQLSAFRKDPVLGGRSRFRLSDFAGAVRRASGEE